MTDRRLLIIDDDVQIREFIRDVAELEAFEVKDTSDPQHFTASVRDWRPTHVVVDLVMPEVDGMQLVKGLAKEGCDARIIVISGYDPSYLGLAERLGEAYGVLDIKSLQKPFDVDTLQEALG